MTSAGERQQLSKMSADERLHIYAGKRFKQSPVSRIAGVSSVHLKKAFVAGFMVGKDETGRALYRQRRGPLLWRLACLVIGVAAGGIAGWVSHGYF